MDKLKLMNEQSVAVGNMRVNARGDALGPDGQVVAGRNQLADQMYSTPDFVINNAPPTSYSPDSSSQQIQEQESHSRQLHNLANSLAVPSSIEISQDPTIETNAPAATPAARGTLADSIAKTTVVKQELLKNPLKKAPGPSRI
jgi:hypothetical protein